MKKIKFKSVLQLFNPSLFSVSSQPFLLPNYRRFQLMRFSVEEINNSTSLLPDVSLGYEIFDHCSDQKSIPGILKLISINGLVQTWHEPTKIPSNVIAVVGPFTSTQALTAAPLFMVDFIPMVNVLLIMFKDFICQKVIRSRRIKNIALL